MKKVVSAILFFGLYLVTNAQPSPPAPDPRWGAKGTRTITRTTDPNNFDQIIVIEYKDDDGRVREKVTWTKGIDGKYTRVDEIFTQSGRPMCKVTDKFNRNIESSFSREGIGYRKDGSEYKPQRDWLTMPAEYIMRKEIKSLEEGNTVSLAPAQGPCAPGTNCQPKTRYFLAYSYLNTMTGADNESFPLGLHASFIYNITSHVGLGLDASIHTKTIYEEKLTRSFLLAEGKYIFGNTGNCDRTVIPDLHILAGLGCEKYGSSKGSGFAFGFGGGLDLRVAKKIMVSTQVDFIGVKFKRADDLNSNIRASAGLSLRL